MLWFATHGTKRVVVHFHDDWKEQQHPRAKSGHNAGQFVKKGGEGTASAKSYPKPAPDSVAGYSVSQELKAAGYKKQKGSNVFKHPEGDEVEIHAAKEGQKWMTAWTHLESGATGSGAGSLKKHLQKQPKPKATAKEAPPDEPAKKAAQMFWPSPASSNISAKVLKQSDLTKVGAQMGSNPGGVYEAKDGTKYYVKEPQTSAHTRNELLAAALYAAAGGNTLQYHVVDAPDGKKNIATKLESLKATKLYQMTSSQRKEAQKDFAIQAWLANWDAVGTGGDNVGVNEAGKAVALDFGGSLDYRAKGTPKGMLFDGAANEWNTLRDLSKNPYAAELYGEMTAAELKASADQLKKVSDDQIQKLVDAYGPEQAGPKDALVQKLKHRKASILAMASGEADKPAPVEPGALRSAIAKHMPPRTQAITNAIQHYKGSGYDEMNNCTRFLVECDDPQVAEIENYLKKAKVPACTLYRGIKGEYAKKLANVLKPGRIVKDNGFVSTSTSEQFARNWFQGSPYGLLLEIEVPHNSHGASVRSAVSSDGEYEILLQRNSHFVIKEVDLVKKVVKVRLDHSHLAED